MIHFGWAIATFFIGGVLGFFLAALCSVAAQDDSDDKLVGGDF